MYPKTNRVSDRYKVYIYRSELNLIIAEAQEYPNSETGGSLFGTCTQGGMFIVWLASGPGAKAQGNSGAFEQDISFMNNWQNRLMNDFALQYIGGWHSHHTLSLKRPSNGDIRALQGYATRRQRNTALEIIVTHDHHNRHNFKTVPRPYFFQDAQQGEYVEAQLVILPGESPLRQHLGAEKVNFSPVTKKINWRNVKEQFDCSNKIFNQNDLGIQKYSSISSTNRTAKSQSNLVEEKLFGLPSILKKEIKYLGKKHSLKIIEDVEIKVRDDNFLVIVPVSDDFSLAVALRVIKQKLSILLVNLINNKLDDQSEGEMINVTPNMNELLNKSPENILSSIFQESLKTRDDYLRSTQSGSRKN